MEIALECQLPDHALGLLANQEEVEEEVVVDSSQIFAVTAAVEGGTLLVIVQTLCKYELSLLSDT